MELIARTVSIFEQQQEEQEQQEEADDEEQGRRNQLPEDDVLVAPTCNANMVAESAKPSSGLKVFVEQISLHNGWGQEHLRAKFPTWEELRRLDPT